MWSSRSLSALQDKFHALSRREQVIVVVAAFAVALFLYLELVLLPTHNRMNRLQASIKNRERDLMELTSLVSRYQSMPSAKNGEANSGEESLSLFSILERLATESGLKEKIEYMRPGGIQIDPARDEKWVEVKLGKVTLREFTQYCARIQSLGKGIYIKRLSARKEGEYLSLILQPAVVVVR